ncbi:MAG: hypothetical protein ACRD47_07500 [Nitrososphaeraceae archaeon]
MDKRRAGNAPEGSGVPVGTEYHWYIVAPSNCQKSGCKQVYNHNDRNQI